MKTFFAALVLLLAFFFFLTRAADVGQVLLTLQRGNWGWITLALFVHAAWILNIGAHLRSLYRLLGIDEKTIRLSMLGTGAAFVNTIAPSAGMSGMVVFITDSRQRGLPTSRVTAAAALYVLYDYLAFIAVLGLGIVVLIRRNRLGAAEVTASVILVSIAMALTLVLYTAMRSSDRLGRALAWIATHTNSVLRPFIRREYLSPDRAHEFAHDIGEGLSEIPKRPSGLLLPFALALSKQALLITIFFLMFLAFNQPFSVGTLIAGYSVGYLFLIVSPTPSGIGFVEGSMTLALASFRIPLAAAGLITLAYRGVTLWLTILYGMISFRILNRKAGEEAEPRPPA
ncbi:MAG: flippase-like domain-containing protein [Anaerolineales bacterium]|nr:flippase-like domain-containing protein [Anaerolineales bacterium]